MTIPSDQTGSSRLTCCGGRSYSRLGMVWAYSLPYMGSHSRLPGFTWCCQFSWLWCRAYLGHQACTGFSCLWCYLSVSLVSGSWLASIKVYLSAVHSLHINNGFPDPLVNRLHLQPLIYGIKCVQGSPIPSHLPITMELMRVLQKAFDFNNTDRIMLLVACCVGF